MQLAINTGSLSLDTREAIAEVKALGFTAVELNLQQAEMTYGFRQEPNFAFYAELARELKLRKLAVTDVHALPLDAAQMFSARARRAVLAAEGVATRMLGANILVIHPTDVLESEESLAEFAANPRAGTPLVRGIKRVIRELQSGGMQLALENVQHWRDTPGTNDAELMARLVKALDCRVALDVRRCLDRPNLARWLELLGGRIVVMHLHDAKPAGERERHPPTAHDWREIIPQLKRTSAQIYVIEISAKQGHGAIKMSRDYIARLLQAE